MKSKLNPGEAFPAAIIDAVAAGDRRNHPPQDTLRGQILPCIDHMLASAASTHFTRHHTHPYEHYYFRDWEAENVVLSGAMQAEIPVSELRRVNAEMFNHSPLQELFLAIRTLREGNRELSEENIRAITCRFLVEDSVALDRYRADAVTLENWRKAVLRLIETHHVWRCRTALYQALDLFMKHASPSVLRKGVELLSRLNPPIHSEDPFDDDAGANLSSAPS